MKRKREEEDINDKDKEEEEKPKSEIRSAILELSLMAVDNQHETGSSSDCDRAQSPPRVPIKPFLSLCNLLIQVLDKIGPTMAVLRQDIHQNIQRLEIFHDSDPSLYWDVVEILKKEVNQGKAKKGPTCSKAFVWLTRSLDFTASLLQMLATNFERDMEHAVDESYTTTLKPWHGWISSTAYKIALKLVPETKTFLNILKAKDEDKETLEQDIKTLVSLLVPLLQQYNDILRCHGLDKLKST